MKLPKYLLDDELRPLPVPEAAAGVLRCGLCRAVLVRTGPGRYACAAALHGPLLPAGLLAGRLAAVALGDLRLTHKQRERVNPQTLLRRFLFLLQEDSP